MEFAAVFDLFRAFLKTENKQQNVSFLSEISQRLLKFYM